jgi:uncharacterized membrane protein
MSLYQISLFIHVVAGSAALATFWLAAALRKGSPLHRRCGQFHLAAMLAVIVSSVPLTVVMFARGQTVFGLFLGFLLVLVVASCWNAWRAIRDRHAPARYAGTVFRLLAALLFAGGLLLGVLALRWQQPLLGVFAAIGVFAALDARRFLRRLAQGALPANWWLREHYGAMIGNGIAVHISFFGVGLRTLLPQLDPGVQTYLMWLLPIAAGLAAGRWLDRRYGRRPARKPATPPEAAA